MKINHKIIRYVILIVYHVQTIFTSFSITFHRYVIPQKIISKSSIFPGIYSHGPNYFSAFFCFFSN